MENYLPSFEWHHTAEGETFLQQLYNGRTSGRKLFGTLNKLLISLNYLAKSHSDYLSPLSLIFDSGILEKPFQSSDLDEVCYKLVFLGKTGVGKTSTVNKIAGISCNSSYFETFGIRVTDVYWPVKVWDKIILFKLQCWDAGNNCMKKYNHIPVVIFFFNLLVFKWKMYRNKQL